MELTRPTCTLILVSPANHPSVQLKVADEFPPSIDHNAQLQASALGEALHCRLRVNVVTLNRYEELYFIHKISDECLELLSQV